MVRLVAASGIAGAILGAAATAGAVGELRIVELRTGDTAPVVGTHLFCKVWPQSYPLPAQGPTTAVQCGETKKGLRGSLGVGITEDSVYVGHWNPYTNRITGKVVFFRETHD